MDCDERLVEVEQRAKSNTKRIDKLEKDNEVLHEMAASVQVLATRINYVCEGQEELNERMKTMEEKPAERLNQIISAAIVALAGVLVGYLFGGAI